MNLMLLLTVFVLVATASSAILLLLKNSQTDLLMPVPKVIMHVLPASFSLSYTSTTSTLIFDPSTFEALLPSFCSLLFSSTLLLSSAFVTFKMMNNARIIIMIPFLVSFLLSGGCHYHFAELQVRNSSSKCITAYCIWLGYHLTADKLCRVNYICIKHIQFHFLLLVL